MAIEADLECHKGEDFRVVVTMRPATNITGWALGFYLRESETTQTILLSLTGASYFTITNETQGVFELVIPKAIVVALATRQYFYNIWRDDAGSEAVIDKGMFTVLTQTKNNN